MTPEQRSAAARKAWETRRRQKPLTDLLTATKRLWEELVRFGPTDEGVETAMDAALEAYHAAKIINQEQIIPMKQTWDV